MVQLGVRVRRNSTFNVSCELDTPETGRILPHLVGSYLICPLFVHVIRFPHLGPICLDPLFIVAQSVTSWRISRCMAFLQTSRLRSLQMSAEPLLLSVSSSSSTCTPLLVDHKQGLCYSASRASRSTWTAAAARSGCAPSCWRTDGGDAGGACLLSYGGGGGGRNCCGRLGSFKIGLNLVERKGRDPELDPCLA